MNRVARWVWLVLGTHVVNVSGWVISQGKQYALVMRLKSINCWGGQSAADGGGGACTLDSGGTCRMPFIRNWWDPENVDYANGDLECVDCPNSPNNNQVTGFNVNQFGSFGMIGFICTCYSDTVKFAGQMQMSCEASWPTKAPTPTPQPTFMGSADCPAGSWCEGGQVAPRTCASVNKVSRGVPGQSTEDGACVARTDMCCTGNCNQPGLLGCGENQYVAAESACTGSEDTCGLCQDCPSGTYKAPGCSFAGIEACCDQGFYSTRVAPWEPPTTCCAPGTYFVAGVDTAGSNQCSGIDSACPPGGWCPGDGTRYTCYHDGSTPYEGPYGTSPSTSGRAMVSTGASGQSTEAGACTARAETCLYVGSGYLLGKTGCGENQYQVGAQIQCDTRFPVTQFACSECAVCPPGKQKSAGCSLGGIEECCDVWGRTEPWGEEETCCLAGTYFVPGVDTVGSGTCSGVDVDCPIGGWCPGDGTRYTCFHDGKKHVYEGPWGSTTNPYVRLSAGTGIVGATTEEEACTDRTQLCVEQTTGYFPGYLGCGENQYQVGVQLPGHKEWQAQWYTDGVWEIPRASDCAMCPHGRYKPNTACTTQGIEACIEDPNPSPTNAPTPFPTNPTRYPTSSPTFAPSASPTQPCTCYNEGRAPDGTWVAGTGCNGHFHETGGGDGTAWCDTCV